MSIMRTKSSFVADKRTDPAFWAALRHERHCLSKHLATMSDSAQLASALRGCARQPCGLAACPVCMARADRALFSSMENLMQLPHRTVLVERTLYFPEDASQGYDNWRHAMSELTMLLDVSHGVEAGCVEFESYVGRLIFEIDFFELQKNSSFFFSFVGAASLRQPSKDEQVSRFAKGCLPRVDDVNHPEFYRYFDKNLMSAHARQAGVGDRGNARRWYRAFETAAALLLGPARCEDLIMMRSGRTPFLKN